MKRMVMLFFLGVVFDSMACLAKYEKQEQLKTCALCGTLAVSKENFSYPFICNLCLAARMKGILKSPSPVDAAGNSAIVPASSRHVSYPDTEKGDGVLSSAVLGDKKDFFDHVLTFDRFKSIARRSKQRVQIRPERTGRERKDKKAFKYSIEAETEMSRGHVWSYLVAQDHTFVTVKTPSMLDSEKTHYTQEPFFKMLYRDGCAVFVLSKKYEVHDFSTNETKFFPFTKKDDLEKYLHKKGRSGQFKEYRITTDTREPKISSIGCIPTFYYALTNDKKTLLVGNDSGYILKWDFDNFIEDIFARSDEVLVVVDDHQFIQDFSRHKEEKEVTTHDYPLDVLIVQKTDPCNLKEQGFVRVVAPEKTIDLFIQELAPVPDFYTYDIHKATTLEALVSLLAQKKLEESPHKFARKFFYSLGIEKDNEQQEAVITITDNARVNKYKAPWQEKIILNSLHDQAWYRDGQVVTWDHDDLISFDYEKKETKRFVLPENITRDKVTEKMAELAFTELPLAGY